MIQPQPATRRSRAVPALRTGHEAEYLKYLSEKQCRVQVKLRGGEQFRGWIEYFDDTMLRLTREGKPNLFLYKQHILTLEEVRGRKDGPA